MTIDNFKQEVSKNTGIPANLLNGETEEEVVAFARALTAYKKENESQPQKKTTAQQFSEWLGAQMGEPVQTEDEAPEVPADYPNVPNSGEPYRAFREEPKSTADIFSDWLRDIGF